MTGRQNPEDILLGAREIAALAGRTDRWVRGMAQAGHFEKDARGKYKLGGLIRGLIDHYEAIIEKGSKSAAASRVTDARADEIELRLAERRRDLIPQEDAIAVVDLVAGEVNKQFTGLPARITRDVRLRRDIEAHLNEAKQKIADAVRDARILAETGRDPTDPDAAD